MARKPAVGGPNRHDFHDSSLLDFRILPQLDEVVAVLSTSSASDFRGVWSIRLTGVLRVEYEMLGMGVGEEFPIGVYDVYALEEGNQVERWRDRLLLLGATADEARSVREVVFASSFYRGWGENEAIEGMSIVCRAVEVDRCLGDIAKRLYERPSIEGPSPT